jgi:hypothetical protein
MVANRLRYMWVLTLAGDGLHGADGRRVCMKLIAEFAERLQAEFGDQPYWYSPELHPGGHGWHVNFFVRRWLPHGKVKRLWGLGGVNVKDWAKDSRVKDLKLTLINVIRLGADYGCKYAAKDWGAEVLEGGAHRYEVAQSYQPARETVIFSRLGRAFEAAHGVFGRPADQVWSHEEADAWEGPPVWCLSWDSWGATGALVGSDGAEALSISQQDGGMERCCSERTLAYTAPRQGDPWDAGMLISCGRCGTQWVRVMSTWARGKWSRTPGRFTWVDPQTGEIE